VLAANISAGIRRTAVAVAWDEESRSEPEYPGVDSYRAGTRDRAACRSGGIKRTSASAGVIANAPGDQQYAYELIIAEPSAFSIYSSRLAFARASLAGSFRSMRGNTTHC
jgi:hypothetical protein